MPVQIHLNGQRYFADDGTDPAELQQYAQMHQQEQAQLNPINQGMQNVFSGINRQIQNYNELPAPTAVPGNTYGMSTQTLNQTAGIIQQDNMNSATARMQQRVQMEQAMEQEKDRAQQIKVQEMQLKNQQAMENFRVKQEEARLKREAARGEITTGPNGTQIYRSVGEDGTPSARVVPITGDLATPDVMPQQYVETVDANGKPIKRLATLDELKAGVPLYVEPEKSPAPRYALVPQPDGTKRYVAIEEGMTIPAEAPKPLTPAQSLDIQKKAMEVVKLKNGAWFDNDRMSENYGQVKPEFVNAFNAEVARQLQAATGGASPAAAPASAGGGIPGNPPMAREALVDGRRALIDEATSEFIWLDNAPAAATPPANVQSSAPIAATTPPNVQMSFDVNNPAFSIQNGNPYLGPVAYPAPNAVPGSLSRNNYVPPPPRSLEEVVADANALKIKLAQERNANLPPVNNGQSLADLVNNGYTPPPPAPPREMGEFEKWMIDTGQTISREADAIMRSALTSVAAHYRAGKNNAVFDDVARRLLDNNVPINVVRERFKQYPDVMNAVAAEYQHRTGRMLPIDY